MLLKAQSGPAQPGMAPHSPLKPDPGDNDLTLAEDANLAQQFASDNYAGICPEAWAAWQVAQVTAAGFVWPDAAMQLKIRRQYPESTWLGRSLRIGTGRGPSGGKLKAEQTLTAGVVFASEPGIGLS